MGGTSSDGQSTMLYIGKDLDSPQTLSFAEGEVALYLHRGPEKPENEDALALLPFDKGSGVLAVADGLGGQPAGAAASRLSLESLAETLDEARRTDGYLREAILDGFELANRRVQDLKVGAGSTLAVLELRGRSARSYHVGDSEILATGQRGKLRIQTLAHSPVGYGVESGLLDEREAMAHEERHLLLNVVGSAQMRIDIGPVFNLQARDTLLLASDGLFDNLHGTEIVELIRKGPLMKAAKELTRRSQARMRRPLERGPGKPDDLAFILFRPRSPAKGPKPTSPAGDAAPSEAA